MSLTSCSVSAGGSERWAIGPDRRGRPAAEYSWSGPVTETRAGEPEESPHHTCRHSEAQMCEDRRQRVMSQQREVSVLFLAPDQSVTGSKASSVGT